MDIATTTATIPDHIIPNAFFLFILFQYAMENSKEVSEATVVVMIWKVVESMRERGDDMTVECLLNEEKLLHLSMLCLERKSIKAVPFNLSQEIINFVLKINKVTMQNFKQENQNMDLRLLTKAVDLLMIPYIGKYVDNKKSLGNIKILTFNNLACIYKKKKKYNLAIKAVSYAIQIEQYLFKNNASEEKYEIIQTYLNKAAILSQMGRHQKAIEEIQKGKKIIDLIEKEVQEEMLKIETPEDKKRIQEKRHYELYMKMIINYNMGAEKEHMKLTESACEYYRQGRKLAVGINNPYMIKKFDGILEKMVALR